MSPIRCLLAGLLLAGTGTLSAQLEPAGTGGDPAIARELSFLGQNRRVLVIGAHPDDEDSELLTILSRGMGTEAAYLSLTRGEGGQNLIGAELGEQLGLLRSEELLSARRVDGARQYFSRAYDFGFSKDLEDTWRHWPRDSVLKDVVRIVRRFRPQVIVSIFTGTARDGHGQHQAAGWTAAEAFQASGDSARFPELAAEEGLRPWAPRKLYWSTRFDTAGTSLTLNGGVLDPAVGQSYHQIAMRSRSAHRSQDMGQIQRAGPSVTRLRLVVGPAGADSALFDGVETGIESLASAASPDVNLELYAREVGAARQAFQSGERDRAREWLGAAVRRLSGIQARLGAGLWPELEDQALHLHRALAGLLGIVPDALMSGRGVVPGSTAFIVSRVWNAGADTVSVRPVLVERGRAADPGPTVRLAPGAVHEDTLLVSLPESAPVTTPYFLRQPRQGELYRWPAEDPSVRGLPFEPPPFAIRHEITWKGASLGLVREATYRYNDQAVGEVRTPVTITPRLSVQVEPPEGIWNVTAARNAPIRVTLTNTGADSIAGRVRLELPRGWAPTAPRPFRLARTGESVTLELGLTAPASTLSGHYPVAAVAVDGGGREYRAGMESHDYPHVRPRAHAVPASSKVSRMAVALPPLRRVGYVRGAADRVPEALRAAGLPVVLLEPAALGRQPLAGFDAIVIGPRAFETEPALLLANRRLLDYARAGGLLIVQYQQYGYFRGGYPPFPMALASRQPGQANDAARVADSAAPAGLTQSLIGGHDRVTDEAAPVRIVDPSSPVMVRPNRLGPADWAGWVQERGLYIPRQWDRAYRAVLETSDPGWPPLRGALLIAPLGKGHYVYTGISFFRQLPAGVPGAFRLFANLLALGQPPPPDAIKVEQE